MADSTLQSEIRKRRPFDSPHVEAFLNLERTQSLLLADFDAMFKRHGTSGPQYNVLRILRGARQGGDAALPCLEIAERMITRVPDITRLVERLEESRLVTRRRIADDRRVVLVSITAKGLRLLARLDQPIAELHRRQLGHLSEQELSTLNRLLVKVRNPA